MAEEDVTTNLATAKSGGSKLPPDFSEPEYVQYRIRVFERVQNEARSNATGAVIKVTLPDGKVVDAKSGITTPMDVAKGISDGLARASIVAKVNGTVWDMTRPLIESCTLELCNFSTPEGKHTFWHSSAHVLGQALEYRFGGRLCVGPPIEDGGFYYDIDLGETKVQPDHYKALESFIAKVIKDKQPFERIVLKKEQAIEMFKFNPFKQEVIRDKVPDGSTCTAYRCGPLIDLCKGPHVPNTGYIKALAVTKSSGAYWKGKSENPQLQRIYGISFPDKKQLKEWKEIQRLAAERDHRKIGTEQSLFFFHQLSPGSCFFLPHGARVYNKLVQFIRNQYWKRGYEEVITPNVFDTQLWETSGHYQHYKENMFSFQCEGKEFALKPMYVSNERPRLQLLIVYTNRNCPGHCVMFAHRTRSYRELPLRMADFGVLHRNELSGALSGLTRVRRFQQDDAHVFCTLEQVESEVNGVLDMLKEVYGIFGFKFQLALSTRPEKSMGDKKLWDEAEAALEQCLNRFGSAWTYNHGDGAFYGPKIDIQVTDALRRHHQCATIQLDFQLPIRFDLKYNAGDEGEKRPVIIHRAILGSVERFMAILIEHTGGKWPLWISPRQVIVLTVSEKFSDYAIKVRDRLMAAELYADVDLTPRTVNKKVREAQLSQYNIILVIGEKEVDHQTVNIRLRNNSVVGEKTLDDLIIYVQELRDSFHRDEDTLLLDPAAPSTED